MYGSRGGAPRWTAQEALHRLVPMDGELAVLGEFMRDTDLVALDADMQDTAFATPFGGGFFGNVYHVRVRSGRLLNTPVVFKRIRGSGHAEKMLGEIRVVSRLPAEHLIR
jgi:hypothetical protein